MDPLQLVLRLLHVVGGAIWVGAVVFMAWFLIPAVGDSGPDGGKVMTALQRRGVLNFIPLVAIVTLLSGLGMFWQSATILGATWIHSPVGMTFSLGALAAIVAFILGVAVMRPAVLRAGVLAQTMAQLATGQEHHARLAEIQALRLRSAAAGRIVAALLLVASAAMAVARYL